MVFGFGANGAVTGPSTSNASFFGRLRVILVFRARPTRPRANGTASGWRRTNSVGAASITATGRRTERARYGGAVKVAVTDCGPLIVTTHWPVPLQALALHPWNTHGKSGVAVSVTGVPGG
jgi:hypothetical protein